MQETRPPTQQETCAAPILSNIDGLIKRENGNVCLAFGGVGEKNTLRRFCCLGGPEQSPRGTGIPHPKGRTVETERKIMWKENTR